MFRRIAFLSALVAAVTVPAYADTIGSLVIASAGATINGTDLSNSTEFVPLLPLTGTATGDLAVIPLGTAITGGTLSASGFSMTFGAFGTFTATDGQVISLTPNFADIYLLGTFTGDGVLAGNNGPASIRISLTQSGASVSFGGTMEAPPAAIPEPSTFALIGSCLVGFAVWRRKCGSKPQQ
jgi:hypothetical protein